MNAPETINIEKYAEALNDLIGVDSAYMAGDKSVDAILELIVAAKKLENRVKELEEEIKDLEAEYDRVYEQAEADIRGNMADGGTSCHWCMDKTRADVVKRMQTMFEERLDISACGYSAEEVVSDVLETLDRVAEEILEEIR